MDSANKRASSAANTKVMMVKGLLAIAMLVGNIVSPGEARADDAAVLEAPTSALDLRRIAVGKVSVPGNERFVKKQLAKSLLMQLVDLPRVRVTGKRRSQVEIRATVKDIKRRRTAKGYEVDCSVSLVVVGSDRDEVRMVLSGRTKVQGRRAGASLVRTAIDSAVQSALGPLRDHHKRLARLAALQR